MPKTKPKAAKAHKWHNKPLVWTLLTRTSDGKQLTTLGTYPTKRQAVDAMEALRKPKTAVHRSGHSYVFEPR